MTKAITSITLSFCLLTISLTIQAQQVVTGQVTQELDGTPLPFATVFIAGTTIGTLTDMDGNFSLTVPIQGSFQIVVSHIGFESVSHSIESPRPFHQINVALQEQATVLSEVVVRPCIPHSQRNVDSFWLTILGENPSRRGMEVLNPEVVQFCLTADDIFDAGILRAFADEPIEIINHNMGYHILYVLEFFEYDRRNRTILRFGLPLFTELTPRNNLQRNRWERNRREAYSVSLTHFIRSLYREQLYADGFLVAKLDPVEQNDLLIVALSREDSVRMAIPEPPPSEGMTREEAEARLQEMTGGGAFDPFAHIARQIEEIRGGDAPPLNPILRPLEEVKVAPEGTFFLSHILHRGAEEVRLKIEQTIYVAFLSDPVAYELLSMPSLTLWGLETRGTRPIIQLLPSDITIFSDGSYVGVLHLYEARNSILGLRSTLPFGYGREEVSEHNEIEEYRARGGFFNWLRRTLFR